MKLLSTKNRAVDGLLKRHFKEEGRIALSCSEFDPDLAAAYIERSLSETEQLRYETHLAACHPCRRSIGEITRLAEGVVVVDRSRPQTAGGPFGTRRRPVFAPGGFGHFGSRWGIAAAAVIALAVTVPMLLSMRDSSQSDSPAGAVAQDPPADSRMETGLVGVESARPRDGQEPAPDTSVFREGGYRGSAAGAAAEKENVGFSRDDVVAERRAEEEAAVAFSDRSSEQLPPQTEAVRADPVRRPTQPGQRADANLTSALPSAPEPASPSTTELAKIDPTESLRLPRSDKDSAEMIVLKPGGAGIELARERDATAAITPGDPPALPPEAAGSDERTGRGLAARARALQPSRESGSTLSKRGSPQRRVLKKRFWLSREVWTDHDYNPRKQLPEVTVVRDSSVYQELLSKQEELAPYLMSFSKGDRAIIVFKDTVYKLVPANPDK